MLGLLALSLFYGFVNTPTTPPTHCDPDKGFAACYEIIDNHSRTTAAVIWGVYLTLVLAAAVGLVSLRTWSRSVAVGLAVPLVALELWKVFTMFDGGYSVNAAGFYSCFNLIALSIFLYYLNRPAIKKIFDSTNTVADEDPFRKL